MTSKLLKEFAKKWGATLKDPNAFFKKEKTRELSYGAKSVLISGIISAVIIVLLSLVSPTSISGLEPLFGPNATALLAIFTLIFVPILSVAGWLFISGVFYVFAKALDGKGTFSAQSHYMAFVNSAFGILSTAVSAVISLVILGSAGAGTVIQAAASIVITVYNLFVITIALKYAHKYTMSRAVLTWLIPLLIAFAIFFLLGIALLSTAFINGNLNPVNA